MMLIDAGPPHPALLNRILQGDYWLFSRINQVWTFPFLESPSSLYAGAGTMVSIYPFFLVFVTLNFRKKG